MDFFLGVYIYMQDNVWKKIEREREGGIMFWKYSAVADAGFCKGWFLVTRAANILGHAHFRCKRRYAISKQEVKSMQILF